MKKRNCRMTEEEKMVHERAVKLRKMTDEQLCAYVDGLEEKAKKKYEKSHRPTVADFIRHLDNMVGTGNGIGYSTVEKIKFFAKSEGFMEV